jgi:cytochrome c peroxidase
MQKVSTFFFLAIFFAFSSLLVAQSPLEELGKKIFFDKISGPDWMACANCHAQEVGFTCPIPGINNKGVRLQNL